MQGCLHWEGLGEQERLFSLYPERSLNRLYVSVADKVLAAEPMGLFPAREGFLSGEFWTQDPITGSDFQKVQRIQCTESQVR